MHKYEHILVTGGAGFIGSNFVRQSMQRHPSVSITVIDKLTYAGNLENLAGLKNRLNFIHGDIADAECVEHAIKSCDAVVNFAAESHVDRSLLDAQPFIRSNVEGTLVLLQACLAHEVGRFLQVSTDEVYGDLVGTDRLSVETDLLRPQSPYAASKAAAEHLVQSFHISFGLDAVTTRGSNTYGPCQFPEKIIPLFATNALDGLSLPLYSDGSAVRDYMHVDDHCSGIDLVLQQGAAGETYNLGARLEITGQEIAETILEHVGAGSEMIEYVADRPGHDYRYAVDPTPAESLGWLRAWKLDDGLRDTVVWYKQNRKWWEKAKRRALRPVDIDTLTV